MLERLEQMGGQMPARDEARLDYIRAKAQARITQLQSSK